MYSHQQTRISIAVLKSRFDPLLDKGQYKNNDKLKNNNNTCNNNYQLCKHEITSEVLAKHHYLTFWHKTGGRGALILEGVLIRKRVLNQIISKCKQNYFVITVWWKLLLYFTYSWKKTAKIKQTHFDNGGAPKLIILRMKIC